LRDTPILTGIAVSAAEMLDLLAQLPQFAGLQVDFRGWAPCTLLTSRTRALAKHV